MMNVLCDYVGHSDLWYSIHALFEKRLGGTLYHPDGGPEWNRYHTYQVPPIPVKRIETPEEMQKFWGVECDSYEYVDGVGLYSMKMEPKAGYHTQRALSFGRFLQMKFDIIVITYYAHEKPFLELAREYQPQAKVIRQIGNIVEQPAFCMNVLWGMLTPPARNLNIIRYHPEHYEGYHYTPPPQDLIIRSFMDDLATTSEIGYWRELSRLLPEFKFEMYGRGGDNGYLSHPLVPEAMRGSSFVWHAKPHGGGGFVPRQALACGRPMLVRTKYAYIYDELTTKLWEPGLNCIDLDDQSLGETARLVRQWASPGSLQRICETVASRAQTDMDFASEASAIERWLDTIQPGT